MLSKLRAAAKFPANSDPRRAPLPPLVDLLEPRRLLTAFPTPFEQYILEMINRARANPNAEVARLSGATWGDDPSQVPGTQFPQPQTPSLNEGLPAGTISSAAKPPLAFNPRLTQSARNYSTTLLSNNQLLTHTFNGTTPSTRASAAGYQGIAGENLALQSSTDTLPIDATLVGQLHDELFVDGNVSDRGHRTNMLNSIVGYREIGVGIESSTRYTGFGPGEPDAVLISEEFGVPFNNEPFLTGVAYNDSNSNNFYDPGEGLGNVTITATRTGDNAVFSTTTWDAGGYSLQVPAGTYTVAATGGAVGNLAPVTVTVVSDNVEKDFVPATTATTTIAPTVTLGPLSQTATAGAAVTLAASATGHPAPTVQWQVSVQNGGFTDIAGATGTTLSLTPQFADSGNRYRAVFTNAQGTAATDPATLTINTALPALTATLSGSLPASVLGGAKTTARQTLTITNQSGQTIKSAAITLYVSPDATLGSATPIGNFTAALNLKSGAAKSVPVRLKSFPSIASGSYFLLARVSNGSDSAVAAAGSTVTIGAPFINLSGALSVQSPAVSRGKHAVVSLIVTNAGNGAAKGTLPITLSLSTDEFGSSPMTLVPLSRSINIKPGASKTLRLSVPISLAITPGSYFVVAAIDPGNSLQESDVNDNTAVSGNTLTIG